MFEQRLIEPENYDAQSKSQRSSSNQNKSKKLSYLNAASDRFWSNADPNDRGTWHPKAEIVKWLVDQGFNKSLAESAGTIIAPDWFVPGVRPKN